MIREVCVNKKDTSKSVFDYFISLNSYYAVANAALPKVPVPVGTLFILNNHLPSSGQ